VLRPSAVPARLRRNRTPLALRTPPAAPTAARHSCAPPAASTAPAAASAGAGDAGRVPDRDNIGL